MHAHRLTGVLATLAFACGGPAPTTVATPASATTTAAPTELSTAPLPLPAGYPTTPVARQLAWVMDVLTTRAGVVTIDDVDAHFAPEFLTAIPAANLVTTMAQMAAAFANMQLGEIESVSPQALVGKLNVGGEHLRLDLSTDASTNRITGLRVSADIDLRGKPTTLADAVIRLPALASQAQLLVATVAGGGCTAITEAGPTTPLAIGSTFKLYVLLAVVDRIIEGKLTWATPVMIRDDWKSLPSGITQDDAAGTTLTVRTLAERMISISDNTATDHLLYTVGRVRVEAAMRATKPSKPTANVPFLSTREMFALKLGPAEQLATYLALPGKKRRHFLDTDVARQRPTIEQVTGWDAPRHIDDLEWFATPRDLCSVMATLDARAHKAVAAPLRDVLAINNGLALDAKTWPYVGYKGGSEPGVMNLTWLLGRDDGKRFVVSLTVNSVAPPVFAESAVLGFATGVLEALALEQR